MSLCEQLSSAHPTSTMFWLAFTTVSYNQHKKKWWPHIFPTSNAIK